MLRSLTAKQFVEWEAYARLEPFNELRADQRAALIASYVYNMAVSVRDRKPISDFMLKWEESGEAKPKTQSWQQQKQIAYMIAAAYSV